MWRRLRQEIVPLPTQDPKRDLSVEREMTTQLASEFLHGSLSLHAA